MPGYSIRLLPFIAIAALAFGGVYIYIGITAIRLGAPGWGLMIGAFGVLGILLAVALWMARRRLARREADLNRRA